MAQEQEPRVALYQLVGVGRRDLVVALVPVRPLQELIEPIRVVVDIGVKIPSSAKRAGMVAMVKSLGLASAISSQRSGAETMPSGVPRTE